MKKKLLVTIVSEQTIPNILMIKELKFEKESHLFISTEKMKKNECEKQIQESAKIKGEIETIHVNEFSLSDIKNQLEKIDFSTYACINVNLTGGTKMMILGVYDFFKTVKSVNMFYVTSKNNDYIQVLPTPSPNPLQFKTKLSIEEYFTAYGFTIQPSQLSGIDYEYTQHLFQYFSENGFERDKEALTFLSPYRGKKINSEIFHINKEVGEFIKRIEFPLSKEDEISKNEIKYLTGEWFEEYIGLTIQKELTLDDTHVMIGVGITKESKNAKTLLNDIQELLTICDVDNEKEQKDTDTKNELDVVFMYQNKLHTIECKTTLISQGKKSTNNKKPEKERLILGETIYKTDSLKNKFGLFAQTFIVTLMDFKDYVNIGTPQDRNNRCNTLKENITRCNLSNIKLIDKNLLLNSKTIYELLLFKKNVN